MCDGQDMECFPIKGNGHPVIDRELYTRCSHHTCYTCLLRRGLVLQAFFHTVPLVDSGTSDFLAWTIPGASPMFLALSTTVVSEPWKNTEVFVALLSGRSCRCTWALWVDDPRNTCWPSVEKNNPRIVNQHWFSMGFQSTGTVAVIDDTPWWSTYWFDLLTVNIV